LLFLVARAVWSGNEKNRLGPVGEVFLFISGVISLFLVARAIWSGNEQAVLGRWDRWLSWRSPNPINL
jgi:hypothetical protein